MYPCHLGHSKINYIMQQVLAVIVVVVVGGDDAGLIPVDITCQMFTSFTATAISAL